jgi:protein-L-isoaspartate O-methyltransferase
VIDWRQRAAELADELTGLGVLTDPRWRSALVTAPRHRLVPEYFRQTPDLSGWYRVADDDPETRDEWRASVYTDRALVTLLDTQPGEHGCYPVPISSSTRPSLMLAMLHELRCEDGMRVLEVGTGCGYNAAVLCARLDDSRVVSVDVVADLVSSARRRLAECGLHPALHVADARNALPALGRFDRLIATCAVERIPPGWLDAVIAGGIVLAPLSAPLADGVLARLMMQRDGAAIGCIVPRYAPFMAARGSDAVVDPHPSPPAPARTQPRCTGVDPALLAPDQPFAFWAQQFLPPLAPRRTATTDDGHPVTVLTDRIGSWARAWHDDGFVVSTGGPSDLWSTVEHSYQGWVAAGRPGWERLGITATRNGQTLWLDSPETPINTCGEP